MEWLQSALERARQRFATADEYPLIDDGELVDRDVIYQSWPWERVSSSRGRSSCDGLPRNAGEMVLAEALDFPVLLRKASIWRMHD